MNLNIIVPDKMSIPVKLFLVALTLVGFGMGINNVVLQLYLVSLGFDSAALGTLFTINAIGAVLLTIPMGIIADRYGRGKIMLFASSMFGLQTVLLLTSRSIEMLMFAFLFMGVAYATGSVLAPLYASFFNEEDMDRAFGLLGFLNILASSLGSLLGFVPSMLMTSYGFSLQSAYWTMLAIGGVFSLAMIPLLIIALRNMVEPKRQGTFKFSLRSKGVIAKFCLLNMISGIGVGTFFSLFPYYLNKKFGVESGTLGTLYFVSNFVQAGSNIIAPRISKKLGTLRTIVASLGLSIPFYLMIPLVSNFTWLSTFYIIRLGIINVSTPLASSLFMKLLYEEEKATANSIAMMASMSGSIIAPRLGSQLMQQVSLDFPAYLGSGLYTVYAISYYFLLKDEKGKEAEQESAESKLGRAIK